MPERKEHFEIHASVVFQLGESLITSPVQALLELIKNSYDADATYCKVTVITSGPPPEDTRFPNARGWIVVEDDGIGMDLSDIKLGWLTISNSRKRQFKARKQLTSRGRTPLGDKGLGRLGTQRLGANLEMMTRKADGEQYSLAIPWNDFRTEDKLSNIAVPVRTERAAPGHGTTLIVSDLGDLSLWQGTGVVQLERQLSQLISPYQEVREFTILVAANGNRIELAEIGPQLRAAAQIHYDITFNGLFEVRGKAKLSYFRPAKEPERTMFQQSVEVDNGNNFYDFLQHRRGADRFRMQRSSAPWFIEYMQAKEFEDFPELQVENGILANPGPFRGIVDYFTLGAEDVKQQSIFDSASEFRNVINTFSGIRVFRDGFGIRVDKDWLMLGAQQTGGSSWYGLRPQNTLGYVALTAKDNSQLEETTDREGFKHNACYENFYELMQYFITFSADAQEFLRRGWNDFRRENLTAEVTKSYAIPPEELGATVSTALARAVEHRAALQIAGKRLRTTADSATSAIKDLLAGPETAANADHIRAELESLRQNIDSAAAIVDKVDLYLNELRGLEKVSLVLQEQIEALREQMRQVHEMVGLGITAEALAHEINNVASELATRTQQLSRHVRAHGIKDQKISTFLLYVGSTVNALKKQLIFLAPSLQFVREKREVIQLKEFISEVFRHYIQRFKDEPISLQLGVTDPHFNISMNRGKLIQVLDNLFLNSEYWLNEDVKMHRINRGVVLVETHRPVLTVSDNGRGVDPLLESSVFEPFVSGKGKGKGRGLGLYIVRQLLEAEGCHIDLSSERNKFGRLFKFEIDLSGVVVD
jgi:signal transduction histidine kinase